MHELNVVLRSYFNVVLIRIKSKFCAQAARASSPQRSCVQRIISTRKLRQTPVLAKAAYEATVKFPFSTCIYNVKSP